jgi:hypothetical protein
VLYESTENKEDSVYVKVGGEFGGGVGATRSNDEKTAGVQGCEKVKKEKKNLRRREYE